MEKYNMWALMIRNLDNDTDKLVYINQCLPACRQYHLHRKRNKQSTMRIRRKKNTSHKNGKTKPTLKTIKIYSISPKSKRPNNCRKILKKIKSECLCD